MKNNEELLDDGNIIILNKKKHKIEEGLKEFAPYDCRHVGFLCKKMPY